MSKKDNISSFQIAHSKIWANGEKYFSLFEKHIPELKDGHKVLVYDISNLDFICKLMSLNKDADFWIYGNQEVNEALLALGKSFHEVAEDPESKTYNIPVMKFDCIIMNPPYQRNLHLKILAEAIKHLKDETSTCVNLSPVRWLQDPLAKYKKNSDWHRFEESVSKHIESLYSLNADEATSIFGVGFWNNIAIYQLKTDVFSFYENYNQNCNGLFQSLVEKIGLPLFLKEFNSVSSVWDNYSKNTNFPYFIKCSRVHGHPGKNDEFDCITPRLDLVFNVKGREGREVYFKDKQQAINFFNTMNLCFYKFLKKLDCYPRDDFNKGLPWMGDAVNPHTGKKGYEGEWTDEDFYAFFNITPEERKIIEDTMEKYK